MRVSGKAKILQQVGDVTGPRSDELDVLFGKGRWRIMSVGHHGSNGLFVRMRLRGCLSY